MLSINPDIGSILQKSAYHISNTCFQAFTQYKYQWLYIYWWSYMYKNDTQNPHHHTNIMFWTSGTIHTTIIYILHSNRYNKNITPLRKHFLPLTWTKQYIWLENMSKISHKHVISSNNLNLMSCFFFNHIVNISSKWYSYYKIRFPTWNTQIYT